MPLLHHRMQSSDSFVAACLKCCLFIIAKFICFEIANQLTVFHLFAFLLCDMLRPALFFARWRLESTIIYVHLYVFLFLLAFGFLLSFSFVPFKVIDSDIA